MGRLGAVWRPSWAVLGRLGGLLGRLGAILGASGAVLERRGAEMAITRKTFKNHREIDDFASLGPLGRPLGGILGRLTGLLDRLGGLLGRLGGVLPEVEGLLIPVEPSWRPSWPLLGYLEASGGLSGGS